MKNMQNIKKFEFNILTTDLKFSIYRKCKKLIFITLFILASSFIFACSHKDSEKKNNDKSAEDSQLLQQDKNYNTFYFIFDNISGLPVKSPVICDNEEIGYIDDFDFIKDKLRVITKIYKTKQVFEDAEINIDFIMYKKEKRKLLVIKNPSGASIPLTDKSVKVGKNLIDAGKQRPEFVL